ncbi:hypothetical protein [uncultured Stenotrophomonas sp.]|uniref:hypothetical protein n=1 Tax=uncultured Stenotrophomonas sp. TaxID=165438 RepID=UPI0025F53C89|nr:hypothetical protein [uncultured Stenotrophomonas sp.]
MSTVEQLQIAIRTLQSESFGWDDLAFKAECDQVRATAKKAAENGIEEEVQDALKLVKAQIAELKEQRE